MEWLILGGALMIRVAALIALTQTPYADRPLVDALTYWQQAGALLEGEDPFERGLYQPPGYPFFLAAIGGLTGRLTGGLDLTVVRVVHLLLGMASSVMLLRLGKRLGERVGVPWAGAAAVALFSLYPTTVMFELDILTPALTIALSLGGLLCVLSPRWWVAGAGGLLSGLAVVVHPTMLIAGAVMGLWRALQPNGRSASGLFFVLLGVCLIPTTVKNYRDYGDVALVSYNGGLNFYLGNNPRWRETSMLRAGLAFRELVLEANPAERDMAERDAYWWSRSIEESTKAPVAWLASIGTRVIWSVNDLEIPRNEDYRCRFEEPALRWIGLLPVSFGLVFPLAIAGLIAVVRRRDAEGVLLVGVWGALGLPLIVFFVTDRYRLPTWPLLCILAPIGAGTFWQMMRSGKRMHPAWLLLLVAAALPWVPIDPRLEKDPAWCLHVQGNFAYLDEDLERARSLYEASLERDAMNMDARSYLASMAFQRGDLDEAERQMRWVVRAHPEHFPSLKMMARILEGQGSLSASADFLGRAWRVPGERRNTGAQYVVMLVRAGRTSDARAVLREDPDLWRSRRVREAFDNP
ncbi:MAG: hypothetical protein AAFV53_41610 [Myxococcota bacterium]